MPLLQANVSSQAHKHISTITSLNSLNMFFWPKIFLDQSPLKFRAWFDNGSINNKGLVMFRFALATSKFSLLGLVKEAIYLIICYNIYCSIKVVLFISI
jgi:hypothetical protein